METPLNIVGANGVYRDTSGEMAQLKAERDAALNLLLKWSGKMETWADYFSLQYETIAMLRKHGRLPKEE